MHFIESWFGSTPDAGSGATELLYVIALAALLLIAFARRQRPLWSRDRRKG